MPWLAMMADERRGAMTARVPSAPRGRLNATQALAAAPPRRDLVMRPSLTAADVLQMAGVLNSSRHL
jgi:hypothetical protein